MLAGLLALLIVEIRRRTDPIVRRLVELSTCPGVSDLRDQVAGVLELSARHSVLLQQKMEEMSAEIRRTDQARYRTAQFGPAYLNQTDTVGPRFLATG